MRHATRKSRATAGLDQIGPLHWMPNDWELFLQRIKQRRTTMRINNRAEKSTRMRKVKVTLAGGA